MVVIRIDQLCCLRLHQIIILTIAPLFVAINNS